jgi:hypothetical protein
METNETKKGNIVKHVFFFLIKIKKEEESK